MGASNNDSQKAKQINSYIIIGIVLVTVGGGLAAQKGTTMHVASMLIAVAGALLLGIAIGLQRKK